MSRINKKREKPKEVNFRPLIYAVGTIKAEMFEYLSRSQTEHPEHENVIDLIQSWFNSLEKFNLVELKKDTKLQLPEGQR